MDAPQYTLEQDQGPQSGGDELPTYDDLAAQSGPNSRLVHSLAAALARLIGTKIGLEDGADG